MKTHLMLFGNLCFGLIMFLLLSYSVEAGDNVRCKETERRALMEFKADAVDEYGILSSWDNGKEADCCNWKGIRCSNRTGHVTTLNIPGNYNPYTGEGHRLSGKVSPSIIELKHLKNLNLSRSQFGGKIPHQLGNLTSLLSLDLRGNYGLTVENLEWLSHLQLLTHLDLSFVNLNNSNDWLQQIFKLSSLSKLLLSSCNLPDSPLLHVNDTTSLNSLTLLDLSFNRFFSPSSYTLLFNFTTSLAYVSLCCNFNLRGSIPEAFGRMMSLEYLDMASSELEGELPRSFRNLTRLHTLDLSYNNFDGPLSHFLDPLAANKKNSLRVLSLGENKFSGSLPDFTLFPSLQDILIYQNRLSGPFPKICGQESGLVSIDLADNQITGPFPNLTLCSSLKSLRLCNNKLEGNIPEAYLSNLSALNYLDLSSNSLTLNFRLGWVPPFQLDVIILENCTLGPQFPNWIKSQRNFSELDISSTRISDAIPLWFWDHLSPRVRYLIMSHNKIQGILPDLSLKFNAADFVWLDMRSNLLSGPIPSLPINMTILNLSQNKFTGSLSSLCKRSKTFIEFIDLSENKLSGELPDCWMNVGLLQSLILAKNNLSGMIPPSIALLDQLQVLQLHDNNINGNLPPSLKNCKDLILLDLSKNKLSGTVPAWIGTHLTSLVIFSVRKNELIGTLPEQICHLRNAHVLDFSQNNISGSIPNCINNITSLVERETGASFVTSFVVMNGNTKYFTNAEVQWKGVPSEYRSTLALLKLIDLSSNRLVGEIPKEFANLTELISLNLSRNSLTGNIITKIGQMKLLESLDLSRNQLSGELPTSLAILTLLSVLDLSNNNLIGPIPSSTQLQSFDASKYAGNELCGLPLPNKCGYVLSPPIQHDDDDDDDDKLAKTGLYASVALGFVTGFWGLVGPIMLRRTWRHAYYKLLNKIKDWIYLTTTLNMARLQNKFSSY